MFDSVTKDIVLTFPHDFSPTVSFGSLVKPGTPLGRGSYYQIKEEYPVPPDAQLLVDEGTFVTPGTPLMKVKWIFDAVEVTADNPGVIRLTKNTIQVVDFIEDYTFKSPVKGIVKNITANRIIIEGYFNKIPLFWSNGHITDGAIPLKVIVKRDTLISPKNIQDVARKVVVISSPLTYKIFLACLQEGATGVVSPSLPYKELIQITETLNKYKSPFFIGILQAFGTTLMWDFYYEYLSKLVSHFVVVESDAILTPTITFTPDKNRVIAIKDSTWGVEYPLVRTQKAIKTFIQQHNLTEHEVFFP